MKYLIRRLCIVEFVLLIVAAWIPATFAAAQSPAPGSKMTNVISSDSYPAGYGAGIIEGLGMIGSCSVDPYTIGDIEAAAVKWIDESHQTIVEITP